MIYDLHHGTHRACLGIVRTIHQPLEAGVHESASAHRAGFDRHEKLAPFQSMVADCRARFAQCNDLSVGGGVGVGNIAVPSAAHDAAIAYHDCADGDFSCFEGTLGTAESFFHPQFIGRGGDGRIFGLWADYGWLL